MSDENRCPNCGYCPHCGRSDERVLPFRPVTPAPSPNWIQGWYCRCGVWVGSHQVHTCPYSGPHWTVASQWQGDTSAASQAITAAGTQDGSAHWIRV